MPDEAEETYYESFAKRFMAGSGAATDYTYMPTNDEFRKNCPPVVSLNCFLIFFSLILLMKHFFNIGYY